MGVIYRNIECRLGRFVWRIRLSKELFLRSFVGVGFGLVGFCRGLRRERGLVLVRCFRFFFLGVGFYFGGVVVFIIGFGDVVDVLSICYEARVYVSYFFLY